MEFKDERYWLTINDFNDKPVMDSTEVIYDGFEKGSFGDLSKILDRQAELGSLARILSEQQIESLRDKLEEELLAKLHEFASIDYSKQEVKWNNWDNYRYLDCLLEDEYDGLIWAMFDMSASDYTYLRANYEHDWQYYDDSDAYSDKRDKDYIVAVSRIEDRIRNGYYAVHKINSDAKYFKDDVNGDEPEDILNADERMRIVDLIAQEMEIIAQERYDVEEKEYEFRQKMLGDINLINNPTGNPLIVNEVMARGYQDNYVAYGKDTARAILIQEALEGATKKVPRN
ncbi:hypothetical protein KA043_02835 [Candidatus Saccharibacteria bacterium]|nr:hypothetical protein [Candidatus Saccharibacteria bacterium]